MITWDIVKSLLLIGAIAAAVIGYGIVLGRREERDPFDQAGHSRKSA